MMRYNIFILLTFSLLFLSVDSPVYYSAVIMKRETLEKSISFKSAKEIKNPGKIYFKSNYIYIVEKFKGVHIINNSDSTNPINTGFINIPGCVDVAMKGNYLYADNAVDLVTINLTDVTSPVVTKRVKDVFPELTPPNLTTIPAQYTKENRPENTIIVEWQVVKQHP